MRCCGRRLLALLLILCCLPLNVLAMQLDERAYNKLKNMHFSVLIVGDSQLAGAGWEGGYGNCIRESYANAEVTNVAVSGSRLSKDGIFSQWEQYMAAGNEAPDFVLLDGGFNDLPLLRHLDYSREALEVVKNELVTLIESIHKANPDVHIIYITIPPLVEWKDSTSGPPSYTIQELYWKEIREVINAYNYVTMLDLFSINPFQYPRSDSYRTYFKDSLHMNEAGYRKTYEYIDNILLVQLAKMGS